jgi:hypothetical protein
MLSAREEELASVKAALLREPEPLDREALVDFTAAEYALRARLAEPAPERCESCEQTGDSVRYRVDRDVPLCDDCVVALDESEPAPEPSAPAPAPSENCDCAPVADALNSWCREAHVAETPSAKWQDVRAAVYRLWDKLGSSRLAANAPLADACERAAAALLREPEPLDRETLVRATRLELLTAYFHAFAGSASAVHTEAAMSRLARLAGLDSK